MGREHMSLLLISSWETSSSVPKAVFVLLPINHWMTRFNLWNLLMTAVLFVRQFASVLVKVVMQKLCLLQQLRTVTAIMWSWEKWHPAERETLKEALYEVLYDLKADGPTLDDSSSHSFSIQLIEDITWPSMVSCWARRPLCFWPAPLFADLVSFFSSKL